MLTVDQSKTNTKNNATQWVEDVRSALLNGRSSANSVASGRSAMVGEAFARNPWFVWQRSAVCDHEVGLCTSYE